MNKLNKSLQYYALANNKSYEMLEKYYDKYTRENTAGFNEDQINTVIDANVGLDVKVVLNHRFIQNFLSANEAKKNDDPLGASMKILSDALVHSIKINENPAMNEWIKNFIQENYGVTEKKVVIVSPEGRKIEGVVHEKFKKVCEYIEANIPIMMIGPSGTGKSFLAEQATKFLGREFYSTGAIMQVFELAGYNDAGGNYIETEFYKSAKAASEGKKAVFCIDEIDASNPEAVIRFNNAMANDYYEFPNGKLNFHHNLEFIACGNTWGLGASTEYVGRNQQDAASLDRFTFVTIGYSRQIEDSLTDDKEMLDFIRAFRDQTAKAGIHHIVSYRAIIRMDLMKQFPDADMKEIMQECLIKNLQRDDINMVIGKMPSGNKYTEVLKNVAQGL